MLSASALYAVGSLAIQGVQEAITLWPDLASVAGGADPTEAQYAAVVALLGADHAALQAAVDPSAV